MRQTAGVVPHSDSATIATARLLLAPLARDEVSAIAHGDRSGRRWADDYPTEGDRLVCELLLAGGLPSASPYCHYQVRRVSDQLAIGGVGFKGPPRDGAVEVGYGLAPSARGQGFMTEAVNALVSMAEADPVVMLIEADTDVENLASQHVLERCGFSIAEVTSGNVLYRKRVGLSL